jgi:catechol-2,3-dioxygenase
VTDPLRSAFEAREESVTTTSSGIGLKRLQHLVLWVGDVERSLRFYRDVLGFEVKTRYPNAAFLKIPGSPDDHHLGLFEQRGVAPPDEGVARMYHTAWEVGSITDLVRARRRLTDAGALVGSSDHGVSLSLYAKDPDGLEFEVFWTVPDGGPAGTRPLDLAGELARRGIAMAEER